MYPKKTICIAGKNNIAIKALDYCLKNHSEHDLVFVANKSDDGKDSWQKSFKRYSLSKNVNQVELIDIFELKNLVFISLEYEHLINIKKFYSKELFNIHFSLLPSYKGMYTSAKPIINGEKYTGVTLHKIDQGIDTGDIVDQIKFEISLKDTAQNLYYKYLINGEILFKKNINFILKNEYLKREQEQINSSYYSKDSINYEKININFKQTAFQIHNSFRAFIFREYQLPYLNKIPIYKTEISNNKSFKKPGEIVIDNEEFFLIATIDYDLILYKDYYDILWKASETNDKKNLLKALKYIDDINLKNKKGFSALTFACINGSYDVVEILLKSGAKPNSSDYEGESNLSYAHDYYEKTKDNRIIKLLTQYDINDKSTKNNKSDDR